MNDLVAFLLGQIAADENVARAAFEDIQHENSGPHWVEAASGIVQTGDGEWVTTGDSGLSRHMVNWDPARVLAESAIKRRIIQACSQPDLGDCTECNVTEYLADDVLRALVQPYSQHPGFRPAWASEPR